ncbi:hypothetical protein GTY80_27915, partial [Amycolatopsis sp. SID8362]|nr:hypothetical protein [Amycolatopsis sp. SID8362]NED43750.1 hypothetical protein [Amycolatopsis sp. SID8362]
AGDEARANDLAADLAVTTRARPPNGDARDAAPEPTRYAIDWLLRLLEARAKTTTQHRKEVE